MVFVARAARSVAACGDGDGGGEAVNVTEACDRLEELADAILDDADPSSTGEVRDAVQAPLDAFSTAAAPSGDERLADLARTADESFTEYLAGNGIGSRKRGMKRTLQSTGQRNAARSSGRRTRSQRSR
jgi:hypothetical protein